MARRVDIGGHSFRIDETAQVPFRRASESKMVPRTEITGDIGKQNLNTTEWSWAMSRFEGGEGRLVFDSQDPAPPHYRKTDGAVDTRIVGEFKMAPVMHLRAGGTETTIEGSALTNVAGTTASGSNRVFDAIDDEARTGDRTPGATNVVVSARINNIVAGGPGGLFTSLADFTLTVKNITDTVDTTSAVVTVTGETETATISLTYAAEAAHTYRYHIEMSFKDGDFTQAEVDFIKENAGSSPVNDPYLVQTGLKGMIWNANWDGTNTDIFSWDFANDTWFSEHANMVASEIVAMANTGRYNYGLFKNKTIRQWDDATRDVVYAADPTLGEALGLAIGANRLYALYTQALVEFDLDETTVPVTGTTRADLDVFVEYGASVSTDTDFGPPVGLDQTLRQQITGIDNGVRWFINSAGEQSVIYEFSDGAARPIASLPRGYRATAISHYAGVTWLGVQYQARADSPAQGGSGIYFIGSSGGPLRFLTLLRPEDPSDDPVSYIAAHGHDIYFLQGTRVWRYDGSSGGLVLDRVSGSQTPATARSLAVQDTKLWAAYENEGVFVSVDSYPKDEKVWLYSPTWDFDAPNNDKTLLDFEVSTDPLLANTAVTMEYALNRSDTWVATPTSATTGETTHILPLYGSTSIPTTRRGRYVQWRVGLSSSDGVDTPVVHAVTLRSYVLEYEPYFEMTILLEDEDSTQSGPKQLTGPKLAANLQTLVDNKVIVAFVDRYSDPVPGGKDTYIVIIEDPLGDLAQPGQGSARLRLKVLA